MCGIIAIIDDQPVAESLYQSLIQLQHRGQDAAGIFTYDPVSGKHFLHKNKGLVNQVFTPKTLPLSEATWGIGHVRYQTVGVGNTEDTQPLVIGNKRHIAIGYNGNIVNYFPLRREMENEGFVFKTNCDAEVLLHILNKHIPEENCTFEHITSAVQEIYTRVGGAYSVTCLITGVGIVAFRDLAGIRPLLFGTQPNSKSYAFASETYALTFLNFQDHISIEPGEIFFIDDKFTLRRKEIRKKPRSSCSFEFNYFAKPNTIIDNREVYSVRSELGVRLAKQVRKSNAPIDVVVSVPNTAKPSGISLARELGIPYEEGFVKQEHIGRTFIMPTQQVRERAISRKLAAVESVFTGKNVIIVDDSLVRGTVSKKAVALAKGAGAKKVFFASTFPPIRHPCIYGIDFARKEELVAWNRTIDEIANEINADGLFYNDSKDFKEVLGLKGICIACVSGNYPTDTNGIEELQDIRQQDMKKMEKDYVRTSH